MNVSKQFILSKLPPFQDKRVDVEENQKVQDIIETMVKAHTRNAWLYDKIGSFFIGKTVDETCDNLYAFCEQNLQYKIESDDLQTVMVPQGLLTQGNCDCKGYASFICGCLDAIKRSGKQSVNWQYCFASYEVAKKTPYHVFSVVNVPGEVPIWVDPTPGADGKQPFWQYLETVKTSGMLQDVIAGVNGDRRYYEPVGGVYSRNPATRAEQSEKAASAILGAVADYPQPVQIMQRAVISQNGKPVFNKIRIGRIGEVDTTTPSSIVPGLPNTHLALGLGGLAVVYMLTRPQVKVIGKSSKKLLPIVALAGIAGYFLYKKFSNPFGNDPELGNFKPVAGVLNVAPGVHAGYAARMQSFPGAPLDNNVYGAVLTYGLPLYASVISTMPVEEQAALYHLVNDYPASNLDAADPDYNALIDIRDKYKFPFY